MQTEKTKTKRKHPVRKIILWIVAVFFILLIAGVGWIYINIDRLLTNALNKGFNANLISDVYELKFEKLSANILTGTVKVYNVKLQPLEKPFQVYPYINSSFKLSAGKMMLKNVDIITLLRSNELNLKQIELIEPGIDFQIADIVPVFFPFKDTTTGPAQKSNKKTIESYSLDKFEMVDAFFHVTNTAREREFNIQKINLSLSDIFIDQGTGRDVISYKLFDFSIGEFSGSSQKRTLKHVSFKDFKIKIDSLRVEKTIDTIIYTYNNFSVGLNALDIQTADSLVHLSMQSFGLSYKDKSIKLTDLVYKPNVSDAVLQSKFRFQTTLFSGTVGTLNITGVNFDSLIFRKKIFIDEVSLDKVSASIFKDKTKPADPNKFPKYLGQTITAIRTPLLVKLVKATNVNLVNRERNPDGSYATANVNRATAEVKNITNLSNAGMLELNGNAYVENKAHFNLNLNFSYTEPRFSFNGRFEKFNLTDLNKLIEAYTPASIKNGTVDELTFSGTAYRTSSAGTLKFLYHDLNIAMELEGKAKWKSSVLAFGANTVLPSANPASADMPARVVEFHAERDMHKSFVNLTIKSILAGLKETVLMSKENKKAFREEKKEAKKEAKAEKKDAKKAKKDQKNK
jgi:hypothetical protein